MVLDFFQEENARVSLLNKTSAQLWIPESVNFHQRRFPGKMQLIKVVERMSCNPQKRLSTSVRCKCFLITKNTYKEIFNVSNRWLDCGLFTKVLLCSWKILRVCFFRGFGTKDTTAQQKHLEKITFDWTGRNKEGFALKLLEAIIQLTAKYWEKPCIWYSNQRFSNLWSAKRNHTKRFDQMNATKYCFAQSWKCDGDLCSLSLC